MLVVKHSCNGAWAYAPLFSHLPTSGSQESQRNKDKGGNGEKGSALKIAGLCTHFSLHCVDSFLANLSHYPFLSDFQKLLLVYVLNGLKLCWEAVAGFKCNRNCCGPRPCKAEPGRWTSTAYLGARVLQEVLIIKGRSEIYTLVVWCALVFGFFCSWEVIYSTAYSPTDASVEGKSESITSY